MAVGVSTTKTVGRLIFDLVRGEETTTRTIEIPEAITDTTTDDTVQNAVNAANAAFTNSENQMNVAIQPANWRDTATTEAQWTTTRVHYEVVTTMTIPVEPDEE